MQTQHFLNPVSFSINAGEAGDREKLQMCPSSWQFSLKSSSGVNFKTRTKKKTFERKQIFKYRNVSLPQEVWKYLKKINSKIGFWVQGLGGEETRGPRSHSSRSATAYAPKTNLRLEFPSKLCQWAQLELFISWWMGLNNPERRESVDPVFRSQHRS